MVKASLSNQVDSQKVHISYSSPSITINVESKPILSANVSFIDDKGKTEILRGIALILGIRPNQISFINRNEHTLKE